jgi:hypothetical protein
MVSWIGIVAETAIEDTILPIDVEVVLLDGRVAERNRTSFNEMIKEVSLLGFVAVNKGPPIPVQDRLGIITQPSQEGRENLASVPLPRRLGYLD